MTTAADTVAESYLDAHAAHDPLAATEMGIPGYDDRLPELTPDWWAEGSALRRRALDDLAAVSPQDDNDRVTIAALRAELTLREQLRDCGQDEATLNNVASPLQSVRDTFDIMPTATVEDWHAVATRLAAVPAAVEGYIASLRYAAGRGRVSPVRQVDAGIRQAGDNIGADGFFATFADGAAADADLPASLRADLATGARAASQAYESLRTFLQQELRAQAPTRDALGRELYPLYSQVFLGAAIDLEETYAWGQAEVARLAAEMAATARRIVPGAGVDEAIAHLEADPSRKLVGTRALQRWMQERSDAAVAALADVHFDIPEAIRTLECRIAPTHTGVIYYTAPSEDLRTRPGRMWWSVPEGVTEFGTWRELTTVYHEGVPGHHLQVAQTIYRRELLNRWRRVGSWISGHGEGWALYAERLMADLGHLDDPADYLGMLDGSIMRACRVVLDIGIHCGLPAPAEVGGGAWDYDKAWAYFSRYTHEGEAFRRFELERYLGWPGQAPSYKVGERLWLQLREDARAKQGDAFDLKAFHRHALDIGSVGLDVLRDAVLGDL
ncbi:MAG: DUF885 domain-containing protein [Jatrophihabitans sp.]|nr:MAG: DUF885 domain-containing protein [Jatrophihabitans sp.]